MTESDFLFDITLSRWWMSHHFMQKSAATWRVNTKRLLGTAASHTSSWSPVHSYFFQAQFFPDILLTKSEPWWHYEKLYDW